SLIVRRYPIAQVDRSSCTSSGQMGENQPKLSRRTLLGSAAAVAGGLAVASCGGSGKKTATTGSTAAQGTPASGTSALKRGGTFRLGLSDSSATDTLDAAQGEATYSNIA